MSGNTGTGTKNIIHPVLGVLDINYEAMQLASVPGLQLIAYSAPARSPAVDALKLLASWGAPCKSNRNPPPASTEYT